MTQICASGEQVDGPRGPRSYLRPAVCCAFVSVALIFLNAKAQRGHPQPNKGKTGKETFGKEWGKDKNLNYSSAEHSSADSCSIRLGEEKHCQGNDGQRNGKQIMPCLHSPDNHSSDKSSPNSMTLRDCTAETQREELQLSAQVKHLPIICSNLVLQLLLPVASLRLRVFALKILRNQ